MSPRLESVLLNILSEFLFWIVLGLATWAAIKGSRSRFLRFFGLDEAPRITVYLSNLSELSPANPHAVLLSGHEFRTARTFGALFGQAPLRLPELVRGLIDSLWLPSETQLDVSVSPANAVGIQGANLIIVGGSTRNLVRKQFVEKGVARLLVDHGAQPVKHSLDLSLCRVRVPAGLRGSGMAQCEGGAIFGRENNNLAVVERFVVERSGDAHHRSIVFVCDGARGDSSWAAAEYLARNWRSLSERHGDGDFSLCLGFPSSGAYLNEYSEPVLLWEYSERRGGRIFDAV